MRSELAIIGNDEAAIELALAAARTQRTLIVLPESRHSSWLLALALRRLVTTLMVDRTQSRALLSRRHATPGLLSRLLRGALAAETRDLVQLLHHAGVEVLVGETQFVSPRELTVRNGTDCRRHAVKTRSTVIATGVRFAGPFRSLGLLPADSPESLFEGSELPERVRFLGGEDVTAGLAALFQAFGVDTTLTGSDPADSALAELAAAVGVRRVTDEAAAVVGTSGTVLNRRADHGSRTVDCRRAVGFTEHLNLPQIGVEPDENGRLWCSETFETWCSSVFGLGDVVGFCGRPPLSATQQAARLLHHLHHSLRPPHFLQTRLRIAPMTRFDAIDESDPADDEVAGLARTASTAI